MDISPDDRFVAVYAVNGEDILDRRPDELICEIQIWDWREAKLIARRVIFRKFPVNIAGLGIEEQYIRYADAGSNLVVYQDGHLLVLNSTTLETAQDIDLGKSQWHWLQQSGKGYYRGFEPSSRVADVEVDSPARRAAVLIRWGVRAGGELRVYDLKSGSLLRKWVFPKDFEKVNHDHEEIKFNSSRPIAIDPEGKKIAISMQRFTPRGPEQSFERNVQIFDVDSGQAAVAISAGYPGGPIRFAGRDPLTLVTAAEVDSTSEKPKKDAIKIWNASTGALIREITSQPMGVHSDLDISADGRVAIGYVGYLKCGFSWIGLESGCTEVNIRFRSWDLTTGKVIATSPNLDSFVHVNGTYYPDFNFRPNSDRLRLSSRGDLVLIYNCSNTRYAGNSRLVQNNSLIRLYQLQ